MQKYQVPGRPCGSVTPLCCLLCDGKGGSHVEMGLGVQRGACMSSGVHFVPRPFRACISNTVCPSAKRPVLRVRGPWSCFLIVSLWGMQFVLAETCVCVENDPLSQCLLHILKCFTTKMYVLVEISFLVEWWTWLPQSEFPFVWETCLTVSTYLAE